MSTTAVRAPEATRRKILEAAFLEFYRNGFQGGSLNHIVASAGTTKGSLFHHFEGKQALGYAVVDEVIRPILDQRWLEPLKDTDDPISTIQDNFRRSMQRDIETGHWIQGCPLNNLAQEMSPLDEGFHERINNLYVQWRACLAGALRRGIELGTARQDVNPEKVATLVVASQMGIWGTGKSSQQKEVVQQAIDSICDVLDGLRP